MLVAAGVGSGSTTGVGVGIGVIVGRMTGVGMAVGRGGVGTASGAGVVMAAVVAGTVASTCCRTNATSTVMRAKGRGPVIGVDCGTDRAFTSDVDATETPSLWSLLGGRGTSRRPNILQILWRAGMVNSAGTTLERRLQSDLLITPPLESVELLDWQGFDRAIEIGYRDACERLAAGALEALAKAYAPSTLS